MRPPCFKPGATTVFDNSHGTGKRISHTPATDHRSAESHYRAAVTHVGSEKQRALHLVEACLAQSRDHAPGANHQNTDQLIKNTLLGFPKLIKDCIEITRTEPSAKLAQLTDILDFSHDNSGGEYSKTQDRIWFEPSEICNQVKFIREVTIQGKETITQEATLSIDPLQEHAVIDKLSAKINDDWEFTIKTNDIDPDQGPLIAYTFDISPLAQETSF